MTWSFMICTPLQIFGWSNQKEWDGRGMWYYRGQERFVKGFGGEIWRSEEKRPLRKHKRRWEGDIEINLYVELGGIDYIDVAQDRDRWRTPVNELMSLWVP